MVVCPLDYMYLYLRTLYNSVRELTHTHTHLTFQFHRKCIQWQPTSCMSFSMIVYIGTIYTPYISLSVTICIATINVIYPCFKDILYGDNHTPYVTISEIVCIWTIYTPYKSISEIVYIGTIYITHISVSEIPVYIGKIHTSYMSTWGIIYILTINTIQSCVRDIGAIHIQ